ncbi:BRCT domain-containing protein [Suillus weaverae]|nr:BRCT domain-containing protein [Suillus weaverae]
MVDLCPRPFRGVTLCATGTMDKPTLFKQAFELGATSTSDLTDRVTHLLANSHGGAKYTCALERKIPIMRPEWIIDSHQVWLRGDDVDLAETVSAYRLPIFSGITLSLSGIDDLEQRANINRALTRHGGTYVKAIERPVKVTHLLCAGDNETEKMRYADKFNKRGEAKIHVVWEEWFWDCLEFGGRFEEKRYVVTRPRPERKTMNEVHDSAPGTHPSNAIPVDGHLPRTPAPPKPSHEHDLLEEEEPASLARTPVRAVTLQLWESLLRPRGFELDSVANKLVRSPSKSQSMAGPPMSPTRLPARLMPDVRARAAEMEIEPQGKSVISSFKRAKSFAPPAKESMARQPFRRTTTIAALGPEDAEGSEAPRWPEVEDSSMATLFAGYRFRLLGEAKCANVRNAIDRGGGIVMDEDTDDVDFIVVRLISGSKLYQNELDETLRAKYRTECWLEHSVFQEQICELHENISFRPLSLPCPIPNTEQIVLSLSGLDQSELCWTKRLLRALGITLAQIFSRRSTHLLCPSACGAKYDKAKEWNIPVVGMAWLEDMATEGKIPDISKYIIGGIGDRTAKGKAKDAQMVDTTNANSKPVPPFFVKKSNLLQDLRTPTLLDIGHAPPATFFGESNGSLDDALPPCEGNDGMRFSVSPPPLPPQSSSPPLEYVDLSPARRRPLLSSEDLNPPVPSLDANGRIPSSSSPSPMKLPPSSDARLTCEPSPVRVPHPRDVARELQESLTTLLGKRQVSEDDVMRPEQRKGKRPRPLPRTKVQSRQESRETIAEPPARLARLPQPMYYDAMSLLDGSARPSEDSLRVTYEDPGQEAEKRKLMALLGENNVGRKGRRKSARIAGC